MNLYKPKLMKRLIALFLAIATMLTALPVTALAGVLIGSGDGVTTINATAGKWSYGYFDDQGINSWRVTLYVSTSDDGKIDPKRDSISGTGLAKVGTIFYNNIFDIASYSDLYVQTVANTETRTTAIQENFSYVSQITSSHWYIPGSDLVRYGGEKTFVKSGSAISKWLPIYGAYTNAPSGDEDFTERVIEDMNECLGGSNSNFYPLYDKVLNQAGACKVGTEAGDKLDAAINEKGAIEGYKTLLPQNDDCVVEWCCVVEPLVERKTNKVGAIWVTRIYDSEQRIFDRGFMFQGETDPSQVLLLDAYETAVYNETTRKIFSPYEYAVTEGQDNACINIMRMITDILDVKTASHSSTTCEVDWGNHGQLLSEYGNKLLDSSATVCYDTHDGYTTYCGVPVAGSDGAILSYGIKGTGAASIALAAKKAATYGGIAVLTTEINDNKIPVYYYIYDENNNFLRKEQDSYTQNETHTFQPSTDHGTPIAMESTSRGDKRFYEFSEYVDF